MTAYRIPPSRFYSLDVLRGVAALAVVFWHWQHFFYPLNKRGVLFSIDKQPLFEAFFIFYKYGSVAVQLFFCLSGFIFFWLYSKRIATRTITPISFSLLRLSRLYPLHLATLIFVAVGQLVYMEITNTYFVYPFNDSYHFVLNLLFASSWGFEKGFAFNAPIWSVSVEVLLYAIFFLFCRLFHRSVILVVAAVIFGHFLIPWYNSGIASGVECFFLGGLVFIAYEKIVKTGDVLKVAIWLPILTTIAWLVTIWGASPSHAFVLVELPWLLKKIVPIWSVFVLFPLTIMSLALVETKRGTLGKRLSFVGDISYSSYLLHFPLQLVVATVTAQLAISQELFYSSWFMVLFFIALILVSFASHRYFEMPMQRVLRKNLGGHLSVAASNRASTFPE